MKEQTFHQSDTLEEAELDKMKSSFIYEAKGAYWFNEIGNPKIDFLSQKKKSGTG